MTAVSRHQLEIAIIQGISLTNTTDPLGHKVCSTCCKSPCLRVSNRWTTQGDEHCRLSPAEAFNMLGEHKKERSPLARKEQ